MKLCLVLQYALNLFRHKGKKIHWVFNNQLAYKSVYATMHVHNYIANLAILFLACQVNLGQ